jgi:glutathione S-transferase
LTVLELFHAAPSYYSMVARLALAEAGLTYTSRLLDIHLAKQQLSDAYRQLNPQMTVPTLRGPGLLLTDSSMILAYAAQQVGDGWLDGNPQCAAAIQNAVAGHTAISIETLTFSKLLVTKPLMRAVVPKVLAGLSRGLEARAAQAADGGASLRAKAEQNRERLATFTTAPVADTLEAMRRQVRDYLNGLPPVGEGAGLFGDRLSSADIVVAVLLGRLAMAGELALLERDDLRRWWQRIQQRPGFAAADIWTRFQRRRFLQSLLQARHTQIKP